MADVVVVGSLNMDLVVQTPRLPEAGETLTGTSFQRIPGGKGANQAVAAGRLGVTTAMIGKVGRDSLGDSLVEGLKMSGVDTSAIMRSSEPTGVAVIEVDSSARNRIVVVPGANGDLTPADVERHADLITGAQVVLIQLEIPMETVLKAAEIATGAGTRVILDPAPARPLPPELLKMVSFMTPNQGEAGLISGQTVTDIESAKLAARALATSGCKNVIVKLGAEGAMLFVNGEDTVVPGFSVNAVDTTAAGDAFAGGFAAALVWGDGALSAAKFANAVAALSVTRLGAQSSIPWHDEVRRFLKDYKDSHR